VSASSTSFLRGFAVELLSCSQGSPVWMPTIDVPAFLALSRAEGILGLLHAKVCAAGDALHLPTALVEGLRAGAHGQAAMELAQRVELQRLVLAFRAAGLDVLLMKGASLAYDVYPDPAWRVRSDVDLLIRPADRARTRACLEELGFRSEPEVSGRLATYQFHTARIDAHGVRHLCDVHWKIANPQRFAGAIPFDDLAQSAVPIPMLGPDARGLGRAHALWLACVHQVAHHYDRDMLVWVYDVHLLAEALDDTDLARFLALADRTGVRRICWRALLLARTRFGTIIPPAALATLEAAPREEPSTVFLNPGVRPVDVLLDDLRVLRGWQARLTLLKEHLFPDSVYMRRIYARGSSAPLLWLYCRRIVTGAAKWFRHSPASARAGPSS
jgi:hypothetical protein